MMYGKPLYLRRARLEALGDRRKILDDLRISFEIEKDLTKGNNHRGTITVYNLSEQSRNTFRDLYSKVRLSVAYGNDDLSELFFGDITNVYHRRERTNWITELYCISGARYSKESMAKISEAGNRTLDQAVRFVAGRFYDKDGNPPRIGEIKLTNHDAIVGPIHEGGMVSDAMNKLADSYGFNWYFNGDVFYALTNGETLNSARTIILSPTTGLLDSPTVTLSGINAKSLIVRDMVPGNKVVIQSAAKRFSLGNLNLDNVPKTLGEGSFEVRKVEFIGDTRGKDWYCEFEAFRLRSLNV
jgi:hypothetical protein